MAKRSVFIAPDLNWWQQQERQNDALGFGGGGAATKSEEAYAGPTTRAFRSTMNEVFGQNTSPIVTNKPDALDTVNMATGPVAKAELSEPITINTKKKRARPKKTAALLGSPAIAKKSKSEIGEYAAPPIEPISNWLINPK